MFTNAYKLASSFTQPVIISHRFFDKTVKCGCGAFVILNDEGWIITVAHVTKPYLQFIKDRSEISQYHKQIQSIQSDQSLNTKQKRRKINQLKTNPKWITNHSFWWAGDGVSIKEEKILPEADLLVGRLDPFDSKQVTSYPVLKDPANLQPGTSLCKLGYPFHNIEATFDESNNTFKLAPNTFPLPRFPIEGIYTRNSLLGKSKDGKYEIKLLETSSPGLKGQSGGPVFDTEGKVWGMQCQTAHLDLDFDIDKEVLRKGVKKRITDSPFLHVGRCLHVDILKSFMKEQGVQFTEA